MIAARRLADRVELVGRCTHATLPDYYAGADVVVVPSVVDSTGDRDGLPNVVLESMASQRPVVASAVAAIPAAVRDGVTGTLVPPRDPDALAGALAALIDSPARRAELGRAARLTAETEFGLGRRTEAVLPGAGAGVWLRHEARDTRRVRPQGLPAHLRAVHRQRDLAAGAARAAAAAVRAQAGRRDRAPPGGRPDRGHPVVPAGDHVPVGRAGAASGCGRTSDPSGRRWGGWRAGTRCGRCAAAAAAAGQSVRARDGLRPRSIYLKEFLQAADVADRLLRARDVRHLHAHFAHGTTTVTWLAVDADQAAVLVHRARQGHLPRVAQPGRAAAPQDAGRLVRGHLHRRQPGAPAQVEPTADVHLVYHGLNADFAALLPTAPVRPDPTPAGATAAVAGRAGARRTGAGGAGLAAGRGRGRHRDARRRPGHHPAAGRRGRPDGAEEGLRRAGRGRRRPDRPRRRAGAGHRRRGRPGRGDDPPAGRRALPGRRAVHRAALAVRAARPLPRRRRVRAGLPGGRGRRPGRHPERHGRGDGGRAAGRLHRGVRDPGAGPGRGERVARAAGGPGRARVRAAPAGNGRVAAGRLAAAGRETVAERFDGDVLARRMAGLFRGGQP